MSRTLLLELQKVHAFDHRPRRHDLGLYHVPYRELTGQTLEDRLGNAARRGECVVVAGASGSGKSSLIQHVLGPEEEGIAPITVPIAVEPVEGTGDLGEVVALIMQAIEKSIGDLSSSAIEGGLRDVTPTRRVGSGGGWAGGVSWLTPGLSARLQRQLPERGQLKRSAASALESLAAVLATIEGPDKDLIPVLVFDDTDRLLTAGGTKRRETVQQFFSTVLPALRDLRAAVVVAAQTSYFEDPELHEYLASVATDRIDVPRLPSSDAVAKVLASRVRCHAGNAPRLDEVITDEAVEKLFELYATKFDGALRKVIGTVHPALVDACESGHETIGLAVIEQAVF